MNEIEKLYENANVEKHLVYFECHRGRSSIHKCPICYDERDEGCFYCSCDNNMKEIYKYPPFTAEKQLKLVNWFIRNEADIEIIFDCEDELYNIKADDKMTTFETFAEALASLVNIYFEDFTDREIEEIREILE